MVSKAAMKRALGADYEAPEPRTKVRRTRGRPSDFEPWMIQKAAALAAAGATDLEICQELGVDVRTLYRWKQDRPDFRQAVEQGKLLVDERVERSLLQRALGGVKRKVTLNAQGEVEQTVIEDVPGSDRAQLMWLFNRRPEKWRQRTEHELIVPVDQPATTPEQLDVRRMALATIALLREAPDAPTIEGSVVAPYDTQEEPDSYDPLEEDEAFNL